MFRRACVLPLRGVQAWAFAALLVGVASACVVGSKSASGQGSATFEAYLTERSYGPGRIGGASRSQRLLATDDPDLSCRRGARAHARRLDTPWRAGGAAPLGSSRGRTGLGDGAHPAPILAERLVLRAGTESRRASVFRAVCLARGRPISEVVSPSSCRRTRGRPTTSATTTTTACRTPGMRTRRSRA